MRILAKWTTQDILKYTGTCLANIRGEKVEDLKVNLDEGTITLITEGREVNIFTCWTDEDVSVTCLDYSRNSEEGD